MNDRLNFVGQPTDRVDEVKRRFDLTDDRRRIVYSGRLAEVKRVDLSQLTFLAE